LLTEIAITLSGFVVEDRIRKRLGGVYAGERALHGIMAIVYGAMLAQLIPVLVYWESASTGLAPWIPEVPAGLCWNLLAMALGVFLSGVRDVCAVAELPSSRFPWNRL